jgi:hypothetical protein
MEFANNTEDRMIDAYDIARFPTADVVEVVRCKDCKYHYSWKDVDDCFYHACDRWSDNLGYNADVDVNCFCSFGERAEE